jgi:hypothetical protein
MRDPCRPSDRAATETALPSPSQPDIDIDFADPNAALTGLRHVRAVEVHNGERRRHVCGVYFQDMPVDPLDGLAVWEHHDAEERGYTKIDFIHNTIYDAVRDEMHLVDLMITEPNWKLFEDKSVVSKLAHIANHFDVVQTIRPRSIVDLAICLALPRPGKKRLIGQPRSVIDREIWLPTKEYYFKKPHAICFAASIVVQLNLLSCEARQIV